MSGPIEHSVPFCIRKAYLWDGSTYGPWHRSNCLNGGYCEFSYPSASSNKDILVCGPGTRYSLMLTPEELFKLYWNTISLNISASFGVASFNGLLEVGSYLLEVYYHDRNDEDYDESGLYIKNYIPASNTINRMETFVCYKNRINLILGNLTSYVETSTPSGFYLTQQTLQIEIPHFDSYNVVVDPNGNYWHEVPISVTGSGTEISLRQNLGVPAPFCVFYQIPHSFNGRFVHYTSSPGKYRIRGYTANGGFSSAETTISSSACSILGKTVELYELTNWTINNQKLPKLSGSVSVDIGYSFNDTNKPILFSKYFY
jgi:hypothetical protein